MKASGRGISQNVAIDRYMSNNKIANGMDLYNGLRIHGEFSYIFLYTSLPNTKIRLSCLLLVFTLPWPHEYARQRHPSFDIPSIQRQSNFSRATRWTSRLGATQTQNPSGCVVDAFSPNKACGKTTYPLSKKHGSGPCHVLEDYHRLEKASCPLA